MKVALTLYSLNNFLSAALVWAEHFCAKRFRGFARFALSVGGILFPFVHTSWHRTYVELRIRSRKCTRKKTNMSLRDQDMLWKAALIQYRVFNCLFLTKPNNFFKKEISQYLIVSIVISFYVQINVGWWILVFQREMFDKECFNTEMTVETLVFLYLLALPLNNLTLHNK